MKAKSIQMLSEPVGSIIHKFSIQQKIKLLGSNSFRGLLYPSDIDIVSEISEPADALAGHFKKLFSHDLPFYFLDFKAGFDLTAEDGKMRWTPKELALGINKGKTLEQALQEDTLIKLDFVISLGQTFCEVSEIYDTKYQTPKTKKQIESELEQDVIDYAPENAMKSIKRFYSLLVLQNKYKKIQKTLIQFFNSPYGLLNKLANDMELILLLTESSRIPWTVIQANIQLIKQNMALSDLLQGQKILNLNCTVSSYKTVLKKSVAYLRAKINPVARELLRSFASK